MTVTDTLSRITPALAAAAIVGLAACGGASESTDTEVALLRGIDIDETADVSPNDGVRLLTAGRDDRIELPVDFEVGQSTRSSLTMDIDMEMTGLGAPLDLGMAFTFDFTQTVIGVVDDGATVEFTIDAIEITDAPPGAADVVEIEFDSLVGVTLVADVDEAGVVTGEVRAADGGVVPEMFADSMAEVSTDIEFPIEPVGVGAVWTATSTIEEAGVTIEADTVYELVELTADSYVVELRQLVPLDEQVDGASIVGELSGRGLVTTSRSNPLDVDMTYSQTGSFTVDVDGDDATMSTGVTVEWISE